MGLDQYAYSRRKSDLPAHSEELQYWRKHNRLQGWMEALYESRGGAETFNCIDLHLNEEDIDNLERRVQAKSLPETGGFFFGDDSFDWTDDDGNPPAQGDYYYKQDDLEFIRLARIKLNEGRVVWYTSWW